jgi:Zn-finger nucleic acid-binding protein
MSTEPKSKAPEPVYCPECGALWTLDKSKVGYLCVQCSRPASNAAYWQRRHEHRGDVGPDLDGAHAAFTAAARRHFRQ